MNPIIEIEKLHVGYENKPDVLKEVSLTVFENDFLGIIGPNGGGKTTLLKAIMGLQAPSSGRISFFEDGRRVNHINIGYLPQINQIDKKFPISVHEVILSGLTLRGKFIKRYRAEDKQRVEPIAVKMGVEDLLHRAIGELSGGAVATRTAGTCHYRQPQTYHSRRTEFVCGQTVREQLLQTVGRDKQGDRDRTGLSRCRDHYLAGEKHCLCQSDPALPQRKQYLSRVADGGI
jgi:ABC-type uncharacterized transport system YnjBCD ATPase subunit